MFGFGLMSKFVVIVLLKVNFKNVFLLPRAKFLSQSVPDCSCSFLF